jgi:hypothetical protein
MLEWGWIGSNTKYCNLNTKSVTGSGRLSLLNSLAITQGKVSLPYLQVGYPNFPWSAKPNKCEKPPKPFRFILNMVYMFLRCLLTYIEAVPTPTNKHNQGGTSGSTNKWLKYEMWEANQMERRSDVIPRIRIPTGPYIFVEEATTGYPMIKL